MYLYQNYHSEPTNELGCPFDKIFTIVYINVNVQE